MEKETSLSESVEKIISNSQDLKVALDKFCQLVSEKYNTHISFCELHGQRWSFIAGSEEIFNVKERTPINHSYGLIYETDALNKEQIHNIKILSKKIIAKLTA
ncbi:MAG: hypothetical protein K9M80_04800 [Candidatus Marinimicrobia bacterium]|nr:hypothetical protein [Candidatus Neomarinimicrobiota bacterium]